MQPSTGTHSPADSQTPTTEPSGFVTPPLPTGTVSDLPLPDGDRYAVVRLPAEGGLGQVFVARDGALNRDVALKRIRPERAESTAGRRRLLREAQVSAQLEHPNIVPVYDVASGGGPDGAY